MPTVMQVMAPVCGEWARVHQQATGVRGQLGERDAHAVRPARDAHAAQLPVDHRLAHVERNRCLLRMSSTCHRQHTG